MNNLLMAEFYKLKRNKAFWVILLFVIGLSVLLHYLIIIDWWQMHCTAFELVGLGKMNALATFTVPLFFNLIVSTVAGFFISTEFTQNGTIKNQIISGHQRSHIFLAKYLVFSIAAILLTVLIPLVIVIIEMVFMGYGDVLTMSQFAFIGRVYALFILQFLAYTAIIVLIAILTEDSGKTIIFSILLTIIMFVIEKFPTASWITKIYEYTIFYQFSAIFAVDISVGDVMKSVLIALITLSVMLMFGVYLFKRKEIK